ncbi:DUF2784 domain-containing protein [Ornithinimicrobium murale]|uniref:DUF2784 domain-containing protein n=1 Tax=Ornithinimicrobium murale TaxID=1050153 RepID=UPI000E0DF928|nr:DUF2784 domain-containing protein [Ornithinimicrobium murale]
MTGSPSLIGMWTLPHRVAAVATMLVHLAFSVVVVLGGFLAWFQPWVLWLHLPALAWGLAGQVRDLPCPLTTLENHSRRRGGWLPLTETGFIDHYFTGVLYPVSWKPWMPFLVLTVVLVSWAGLLIS